MVNKQIAERISLKIINVLAVEINTMSFKDSLNVTLYVTSKLLDGCFNIALQEELPHNSAIIILGIMNVKDEIINRYNQLPSKMMKLITSLKGK